MIVFFIQDGVRRILWTWQAVRNEILYCPPLVWPISHCQNLPHCWKLPKVTIFLVICLKFTAFSSPKQENSTENRICRLILGFAVKFFCCWSIGKFFLIIVLQYLTILQLNRRKNFDRGSLKAWKKRFLIELRYFLPCLRSKSPSFSNLHRLFD
jgi:hypothetical protein